LITKVSEYKSSNHSLSKDFQLTLEQRDMLMGQKSNLENYLETMQVLYRAACFKILNNCSHYLSYSNACMRSFANQINHQHEQFKLESTIGQQAKLIDFLQAKVENPPKKKRGVSLH
jgi:FtsZ-binding cell division protein ZapB